jgi:DNA-binding SARP family transcriptional activator
MVDVPAPPARRSTGGYVMSEPSTLRFEILGPLRLWRGETELDAGPHQQRCLLKLLLAAGEQPLGIHDLVDLIWESEPPSSAVNIVHKYVSALRRVLEPGLAARDSGTYLLRHGSGYRLSIGTAAVDLPTFRRHLADATTCEGMGASVQALDHYTDALRLVRGPAGSAPAESLRAAAVFTTFDGQFFDAAVAAAVIAVRLGRPAEVLPALRLAATMNPMHEPVHAGLVIALAAAGRQAEALATYRTIRERLRDELGIDPGPALLEAQRRVLTQTAVQSVTAAPVQQSPQPAQLPPDLPLFTGRAVELAALDDLVAGVLEGKKTGPLVVAMDGMGGAGKSTLAVRFAHQVSTRFPDGRLYLDLRGDQDEPVAVGEALRSLLYALGVDATNAPDTLDAQIGMYRSLTADKRILVLLDNARDPGQVRPLLPNSPASTTLVTSRRSLLGLAAFDGAHLMHVELPDLAAARELLSRRLAGLPNRPVGNTADEIIGLCGRLPLALAIVGARLAVRPHLSPETVVAELRDGAHCLSALSVGAGDNDPRTAFSWSYRQLSAGAARLFRFLSVGFPSGVRVTACASLAGQDVSRTRRGLVELTDAALVTEHDDGRFTSHVLVRAYADELFQAIEPAEERRAARRRLLEFHLHSGYRAHRRGPSVVGQRGVHRGDRTGALADRGGDPFDRTGAQVADREDPGGAGLEGQRRPVVGAHEAALVLVDAGQPVRDRIGADEAEQRPAVEPVLLCPVATHDDRLEGVRAEQVADRGTGVQADRRVHADPVGQVGRHPGAEVVAADDQIDGGATGGQRQSGLPGRVGATDDGDRLALVTSHVQVTCRVPDAAGPLERHPTRNVEASVVRAGRGDHRAGLDSRAVRQQDRRPAPVGQIKTGGGTGREDLYPELQRLDHREPGQGLAADALREAEVVLDAGTLGGLPTDAGAVEQRGDQAFGRGVDGGGQAGGPAADHHHIGRPAAGTVGETECLGQRTGCGPAQDRTGDHRGRQVCDPDLCRAHQGEPGHRGGVKPGVRQQQLGHVPAQLPCGRVTGPADDLQGMAGRGPDGVAAGPERLDQHVRDVDLLSQHATQPGRADPDHRPGDHHPGGQVDVLPGEQAQLAEEVAGSAPIDAMLRLDRGRLTDDVDGRRTQQEQVVRLIAGDIQPASGLDVLHVAVRGEPAELLVVQARAARRVVGHR